jgi:hypothetical protein
MESQEVCQPETETPEIFVTVPMPPIVKKILMESASLIPSATVGRISNDSFGYTLKEVLHWQSVLESMHRPPKTTPLST